MKILHIIAGMDPRKGGVGQAVRTMVASLAELGVESETVCLDGPESAFLRDDDFTIHALGPGKGPWCYAPALLPWLTGNLGRFNAVIVHGLWLSHGFMIRKAMINLALNNKNNGRQSSVIPKLFIMPHGMLDPYFQKAGGRKLKAIRNQVYWKLIEGKVVNMADGVLFTCEIESILARQPFSPYHPKRELVVGLGVSSPPPFTREMSEDIQLKFPQIFGQPYLLYLGRVDEKKGVDMLLHAYEGLVKEQLGRVGQYATRLVIAGPGMETTYGQKLQKFVNDHEGVKDKVVFVGMVTGNTKWGLLYGCEAFVLPSHQENFGIAVVESLATGKPVLISNQVNIWKEILSAEAGIVADDTNEGTAELLQSWAELSAKDKTAMSVRARECYIKSFSTLPVAKRLVEALNYEVEYSLNF